MWCQISWKQRNTSKLLFDKHYLGISISCIIFEVKRYYCWWKASLSERHFNRMYKTRNGCWGLCRKVKYIPELLRNFSWKFQLGALVWFLTEFKWKLCIYYLKKNGIIYGADQRTSFLFHSPSKMDIQVD